MEVPLLTRLKEQKLMAWELIVKRKIRLRPLSGALSGKCEKMHDTPLRLDVAQNGKIALSGDYHRIYRNQKVS
jgi:hypothetical protein